MLSCKSGTLVRGGAVIPRSSGGAGPGGAGQGMRGGARRRWGKTKATTKEEKPARIDESPACPATFSNRSVAHVRRVHQSVEGSCQGLAGRSPMQPIRRSLLGRDAGGDRLELPAGSWGTGKGRESGGEAAEQRGEAEVTVEICSGVHGAVNT